MQLQNYIKNNLNYSSKIYPFTLWVL